MRLEGILLDLLLSRERCRSPRVYIVFQKSGDNIRYPENSAKKLMAIEDNYLIRDKYFSWVDQLSPGGHIFCFLTL